MKATWNGNIVAESEDTLIVEGNHYFPADSLRREYFAPSDQKTTCAWKGEASYYDLDVGGRRNPGAAWYYPAPKPAAAEIAGRVAFWRGVVVSKSAGNRLRPARHTSSADREGDVRCAMCDGIRARRERRARLTAAARSRHSGTTGARRVRASVVRFVMNR